MVITQLDSSLRGGMTLVESCGAQRTEIRWEIGAGTSVGSDQLVIVTRRADDSCRYVSTGITSLRPSSIAGEVTCDSGRVGSWKLERGS
jgi:hypothetical protein